MKHGCHNKPRSNVPLLVRDGYVETGFAEHFLRGRLIPRQEVRIPVVRDIKTAFDVTKCKHDKRATDPGCDGCSHAVDGEAAK